MRRITALALSITLCLMLCSCTGSSPKVSENVLDIRAKYLGAERIGTTLSVKAESGERVYDFKVRFSGDENSGAVEIIEPDMIAGLKAEIRDGRAILGFDGVFFDIGELFGSAESPLEAIPQLIDAWKNARITSSYAEKRDGALETVMETAIGSGGCLQRTWFGADMLPVYAEIEDNGSRIISCYFDSTIIE